MKQLLSLALFVALLSTACKKDTKSKQGMEKEGAKIENSAAAMNYAVNLGQSTVNWTGSKPVGTHTGFVPLKSGSLKVNNGQIVGGSFVLDMMNLTNTDLKPEEGRASLEAHLKGTEEGKEDDFFNVNKYPTGKFDITKVTKYESSDNANALIYGDLTLKGKTMPISFKASVSEVNGVVSAESEEFKIDRTKWGIEFMSKNFVDNLKDKFINDEIAISIKLKASK